MKTPIPDEDQCLFTEPQKHQEANKRLQPSALGAIVKRRG